MTINSITKALLRTLITSVADEMGVALVRTAYSANIKERKDCSTQIFDSKGRIIAQGAHIPMHLGSMIEIVPSIRSHIKEIRKDDVYISNDPFGGASSHTNDICVIAPFFYHRKLLGFVANTGHHADVGGMVPGSTSSRDSSIYQEGLRLPPIRVVNAGRIDDTILSLLQYNTRDPQMLIGDMKAQIGACELGKQRLTKIIERNGEDIVLATIEAILDDSERETRLAIARIRNGEYSFCDYLDCDGIRDAEEPLPIKAKVTVKDDELFFDFTGSSPQVNSGINLVKSGLLSAVWYAIKILTKPDLRINDGFIRPIHVYAPEGSIVNATLPAPVGDRGNTAQRAVDVILGALYKAVPKKAAAGASHSTMASICLGGLNGQMEPYIYVETNGGGMGGRYGKDGIDGIQVHLTNTSNLPIEVLENEYPLRVTRYGLRPDTGGAGEYRGGLGIERCIVPLGHSPEFALSLDRHDHTPWGVFGAAPGSGARVTVNGEKIGSRSVGVLNPGDEICLCTPGGGGYGDPYQRDPARVLADIVAGKISQARAKQDYGVAISDGDINTEETKQLRSRQKDKTR